MRTTPTPTPTPTQTQTQTPICSWPSGYRYRPSTQVTHKARAIWTRLTEINESRLAPAQRIREYRWIVGSLVHSSVSYRYKTNFHKNFCGQASAKVEGGCPYIWVCYHMTRQSCTGVCSVWASVCLSAHLSACSGQFMAQSSWATLRRHAFLSNFFVGFHYLRRNAHLMGALFAIAKISFTYHIHIQYVIYSNLL